MNSEIFTNSKWLTYPGMDAVLTRTAFTCENIRSAELYITALGYFEAFINGTRVSDEQFIPAMTDYEKRDLSKIHMPIFDTFSHRIYYYKYDISAYLCEGKNVLSTHIGAGWYGQHESPNEGMPYWGDNTLVFTLVITDNKGETKKALNLLKKLIICLMFNFQEQLLDLLENYLSLKYLKYMKD